MRIRPLVLDDVPAAAAAGVAALDAVKGDAPPYEGARRAWFESRMAHCARTDPEGAWLAEDAAGVAGAALATVRDGVWFLSLLVVRGDLQGSGLGRRLLDAALATSAGCDRAGIASSSHPGALRRYARAGFALHPAFEAAGPLGPRGDLARGVREVALAEARPLFDDVDRRVRRATRGPDWDLLASAVDRRFLTVDEAGGSGYAVLRGSAVDAVAATSVEVAQRLLGSGLATLTDRGGGDVRVMGIAADQQWAVAPVLDAGLALRAGVTVCRRGPVAPDGPYLLHAALG